MEHNTRKDEQNEQNIEGLPLNNDVNLLKSLWGFVDCQRDRFDEFENRTVCYKHLSKRSPTSTT